MQIILLTCRAKAVSARGGDSAHLELTMFLSGAQL